MYVHTINKGNNEQNRIRCHEHLQSASTNLNCRIQITEQIYKLAFFTEKNFTVILVQYLEQVPFLLITSSSLLGTNSNKFFS
jgi:hypothetical protein